ncbi:MAG: type II toxin-antitoxin system death-on-curing family toxin [Gemmatimonadaceae bacterium]
MKARREPRWLSVTTVEALHETLVQRVGGGSGIRDRGLLESALARAPQRFHHVANTDHPSPAATLAFGLARRHPFVDGNKRTAWIVAATFLEINGYHVTASETETVISLVALASGEMSEPHFAEWLRANTTKKRRR